MAGWFRRPRDGDAVTSGVLGDLIEVFQPSRRHVEEERQRQQHHAQLPQSGAPPLSVDLDAGVVYLPGPAAAPEPERDEQPGPATDDPGVDRPHR